MSSRRRVNEERLEALLEGRPDGDEREQELARILRELRAQTPAAPAALRERVRSLAPAEVAPRESLIERVSLRRAALVVALAAVVAALGAAMVAGVRTAATGGGPEGGGGGGEAGASAEEPLEVMDLFELVARSAGIEVGGHTHARQPEVRP